MVDGVDGVWEIAMVNSVPTKNRFGLLEEDSDSESDDEPVKKDDGEEKLIDRLSIIRELVMELEDQEEWDKAVAEADGGWLSYKGEEWQLNQEEEEVWSCYDDQEEFKGMDDLVNSDDEDEENVCLPARIKSADV